MHKCERVGIIATSIGTVRTVTCFGPLSPSELAAIERLHHAPRDLCARHLRWIYAWVLGDARRFSAPASYIHRRRAQSWAALDPATLAILRRIMSAVFLARDQAAYHPSSCEQLACALCKH